MQKQLAAEARAIGLDKDAKVQRQIGLLELKRAIAQDARRHSRRG